MFLDFVQNINLSIIFSFSVTSKLHNIYLMMNFTINFSMFTFKNLFLCKVFSFKISEKKKMLRNKFMFCFSPLKRKKETMNNLSDTVLFFFI